MCKTKATKLQQACKCCSKMNIQLAATVHMQCFNFGNTISKSGKIVKNLDYSAMHIIKNGSLFIFYGSMFVKENHTSDAAKLICCNICVDSTRISTMAEHAYVM